MFTRIKGKCQSLWPYLSILIGTAILTFGMYNIHQQSAVTEGGVLGLILLLNHWFGLPQAIASVVLDGLCYALGFKFLGKEFLKRSLFASGCCALFFAIFTAFPPLLPPLNNSPLLAALLGGLFVGVGVGLVVRQGAAAGGDDALALIISRVTKCRISRAYLLTDFIVLALSLTYIPFGRIFYSLITVTVSSFVIGIVEKLGHPAKAETGKAAAIEELLPTHPKKEASAVKDEPTSK